jgi:hypothetical protein
MGDAVHLSSAEALGASANSFVPERQLLRAPHPEGGAVLFGRALPDELPVLHALALKEIGRTANLSVLQSVHRHNLDSLWTILREEDETGPARIAGLHAYLHLNSAGYATLQAGAFDACDPALAFLAGAGERPAAIYVWAVVARKLRAIVSPLIPVALPRAIYGDLPILARAGTIGGLKRLTRVAAEEGNESAHGLGDLFRVDLARTDVPRALQ